jgi:hypothetical protein
MHLCHREVTHMNPYTLDLLPGEPILYTTLSADFDLVEDLPCYAREILSVLDSLAEPVYYIGDIRALNASPIDIIRGANLVARGNAAYLRHPNMKISIGVIDGVLMEAAARGLNSEAFGFVRVVMFTTPEEALAYARAQIRQNA